jgi:hypothetical protein
MRGIARSLRSGVAIRHSLIPLQEPHASGRRIERTRISVATGKMILAFSASFLSFSPSHFAAGARQAGRDEHKPPRAPILSRVKLPGSQTALQPQVHPVVFGPFKRQRALVTYEDIRKKRKYQQKATRTMTYRRSRVRCDSPGRRLLLRPPAHSLWVRAPRFLRSLLLLRPREYLYDKCNNY